MAGILDKFAKKPAAQVVQEAAVSTGQAAAATTAVQSAAPAGLPAQALGGGTRLAAMKGRLQSTPVTNRTNKILLGTAWYLLKEGRYMTFDRSKSEGMKFTFTCLKATCDKDGVSPNMEGYQGPRVGEDYDLMIWQGGDYTDKNNRTALQVCVGWTAEQLKGMQLDENIEDLVMLLDNFMGIDTVSGNPSGKPCFLSNQVVIEIKSEMSPPKEATDDAGNTLYTKNAAGELVAQIKTYKNEFWNRRIPLAELQQAGVSDDLLLKAFGSEEAIGIAAATEEQLDSMCQ